MIAKERLAYLDQAKGIAILLLLLSHTIAFDCHLKSWITAFDMPIFFIICGILTSLKKNIRGGENFTS